MNDILLFFKIIHGINDAIPLPQYILQYDQSDNSRHFIRQTRQYNDNDHIKFKCTVTPRIDAFGKSFFVRTVKSWNDLPFEIRNFETFNTFKTKLKEHLWLIAEQSIGIT